MSYTVKLINRSVSVKTRIAKWNVGGEKCFCKWLNTSLLPGSPEGDDKMTVDI